MREDIKQRIKVTYENKIPNGYQRTNAGLMPVDWLPVRTAGEIFVSHTNKKHDGTATVLSATQDRGIVPRSEVDIDIKYDEENLIGYKKVAPGDFIISLRSFQGGIEYSTYEGLVSPAYTVLKNILPISEDYYRNYLKTADFISRLNSVTYGIRDGKQISYQDFKTLTLHYPPLPEQQKIAEILNHCDKVIKLKQQLIEEERNRKKWLMQNLFDPDNGVRLPGFSGKWRKYKLGDLCEVRGGGTPSTNKEVYWKGDIPWISSTDVIEGEIYEVLPTRYITQDAIDSSATQICPKGSILIVSRVGVGKLAIAPVSLCTSQDFTNLINVNGNVVFWATLLKNILTKTKTQVQGTSIKGVTVKEIKEIKLSLPSEKEQNFIAKILFMQDNKIGLLKQELTQWRQKKKALMQLLLIGTVRVSV